MLYSISTKSGNPYTNREVNCLCCHGERALFYGEEKEEMVKFDGEWGEVGFLSLGEENSGLAQSNSHMLAES